METKVTATVVINRYFGKKEGQNNAQFLAELKDLTEVERLELATGAARQLGLIQDQVAFAFQGNY